MQADLIEVFIVTDGAGSDAIVCGVFLTLDDARRCEAETNGPNVIGSQLFQMWMTKEDAMQFQWTLNAESQHNANPTPDDHPIGLQ